MRVVAFDIGSTSIKSQPFDNAGQPLQGRSRRRTPRPCRPEELVAFLAMRATNLRADRVGLGFPGDLEHGVVTDCGNLARTAGAGSPQDDVVRAMWKSFPLEARLRDALRCPVRVDNDAHVAARGCVSGHGRELVLTLGTGLGVAFTVDGVLQPVPDVGGTPFEEYTFDEAVGESSRLVNEEIWVVQVTRVLAHLRDRFEPDVVRLCGGNARRLRPDVLRGTTLVIERGDPALVGAAKLALL